MGAIKRSAVATVLATAAVLNVAGAVGDSTGVAAAKASATTNDADLMCPASMVWDGHKCILLP
jgi:hypothetical protein